MELEYAEARQFIIEHPETVLRKAAKSGYICPCCGSGGGKHGTGITESKRFPNRFTCFAGDCFTGATVIDIVAKAQNLSDGEAFFYCLDLNDIALAQSAHKRSEVEPIKTPVKETEPSPPAVPPEVIQADIEKAVKDVDRFEYLQSRGISKAVQKHFNVGLIRDWITPAGREKPNYYPSPRCIIPTNEEKTSYLARDVRSNDQLNESGKAYSKMKTGNKHRFHWECLRKARGPVYVTEGEIDAMSVYQTGLIQTIALGSTAYVKRLLEYLQEEKISKKVSFGLLLDNDKAGRKANDKLLEGLKNLGYYAEDASSALEPFKDANEALCANRQRLAMSLKRKFMELKRHSVAAVR